MQQLTAKQIDQLKALLAPLGLNVTKARKPRTLDQLARVKAWRPETAAGRACKSSMLYWASLPPIKDYSKHPCVDTLLRFFGYRGVGANELGGYNPKGLWVASIAKHYSRQVTHQV